MEERQRPYLGKYTLSNGNSYVVLFPVNEQNYGIIVASTVENNPKLQVGYLGDFDEESFEYVANDEQVILFND